MGGLGLGIAIAWLVIYFLDRFKIFDVKILGSVVFVIAGGTVTAFLRTNGANSPAYAWVGYCVGLFVGVLFFGVMGAGRSQMQVASKDPRVQLLDELHARYARDTLSLSEYTEAKGRILDDIKKNPALQTDINTEATHPPN